MSNPTLCSIGGFVRRVVGIACMAMLMTGCAANMAATGQNGPDLGVVAKESNRQNVERYLGLAKEIQPLANGHYVAVYDVQAKTKPSMARAVGHGTLDLFTFGLWEVVGGPVEAYKGRRLEVRVEYDAQNKVVRLESKQQDLL